MIILDIESTGLTHDCGIYEIGAINLEGCLRTFLQDCRLDEGDTIIEEALKVNGRTLEQLFDKTKQSQEQLINNYLNWVEEQNEKIFWGQNVNWDIEMIQAKSIKYEFHKSFLNIHAQRGMDLHTLVQEKYYEIHGKYLLDNIGKSAFNLGKTLEFCGMQDNRAVHNAFEDCKLEGEVLYRLKFGKKLFPEYKKFEIPDYLKK